MKTQREIRSKYDELRKKSQENLVEIHRASEQDNKLKVVNCLKARDRIFNPMLEMLEWVLDKEGSYDG